MFSIWNEGSSVYNWTLFLSFLNSYWWNGGLMTAGSAQCHFANATFVSCFHFVAGGCSSPTLYALYTFSFSALPTNWNMLILREKNKASQRDPHRPCERCKHLQLSAFNIHILLIVNAGNWSGGLVRKNISWKKSNISLVVPLSNNNLTTFSCSRD